MSSHVCCFHVLLLSARRYKEGAVARLTRELQRLIKLEPMLAVREAELAEVTAQVPYC